MAHSITSALHCGVGEGGISLVEWPTPKSVKTSASGNLYIAVLTQIQSVNQEDEQSWHQLPGCLPGLGSDRGRYH